MFYKVKPDGTVKGALGEELFNVVGVFLFLKETFSSWYGHKIGFLRQVDSQMPVVTHRMYCT